MLVNPWKWGSAGRACAGGGVVAGAGRPRPGVQDPPRRSPARTRPSAGLAETARMATDDVNARGGVDRSRSSSSTPRPIEAGIAAFQKLASVDRAPVVRARGARSSWPRRRSRIARRCSHIYANARRSGRRRKLLTALWRIRTSSTWPGTRTKLGKGARSCTSTTTPAASTRRSSRRTSRRRAARSSPSRAMGRRSPSALGAQKMRAAQPDIIHIPSLVRGPRSSSSSGRWGSRSSPAIPWLRARRC